MEIFYIAKRATNLHITISHPRPKKENVIMKKTETPSQKPLLLDALLSVIHTIFSVIIAIIVSASKTARNNPDQGIIHGRREHYKDDR